jgi:hypothetical protein
VKFDREIITGDRSSESSELNWASTIRTIDNGSISTSRTTQPGGNKGAAHKTMDWKKYHRFGVVSIAVL